MPEHTTIPPLTTLSEEEELFRRTVRDFAERAVRPRVAAMEQAGSLDRSLLAQCFELGLMGIEIPETYGGAGGNMLMTVLAVGELSAVDAPPPLFVDGPKTPVNEDGERSGEHTPELPSPSNILCPLLLEHKK